MAGKDDVYPKRVINRILIHAQTYTITIPDGIAVILTTTSTARTCYALSLRCEYKASG